jgi:phenylacetate-CoA ligase
MDLRAALAYHIFGPLYERHWGLSSGDLRRQLIKSERLAEEEVRERQFRSVLAIVADAAVRNPFYRERWSALRLDPRDLRELDDLTQWPVLTKDDLREHSEQMVSEGYVRSELFHKRTGGSTGIPVHVWWDVEAHRMKSAIVKRHDGWAGYRLGTRRAALWGDTNKAYPLNVRIHKALVERTIYLDTLEMDEATLRDFVIRLRRFRPRILIGHAHSLYFLVDFLRSEGIDDLSFDGIISTAETLVPAERDAIEAMFGKVLFDRYGCEEVSLIASECEEHDGLHVAAESVLVEVVGGDETTPGKVVVTDLVNRGMPLIRYEVGDLATARTGKCACGRGLPRLGRVFGRTTDILYAPDGRRISGVSILDTFLIHIPGVRQAQIVQDALDHLVLRVVPDRGFDQATIDHLARTVTQVFGPAMRHELRTVESIEPTARGKFQFTICEIPPPGPST